MKKTIFILALCSFFIICFFAMKFPVIIAYGITVTTIDLIFKTKLLSNCIYLQIFILDFILTSYIVYRSKNSIYRFIDNK